MDASATEIQEDLARCLPEGRGLRNLSEAILGFLTAQADGFVDRTTASDLARLAHIHHEALLVSSDEVTPLVFPAAR